MSKILDAIDKLAKNSYGLGWADPAVRTYIATGDENALKSIPAIRDSWLSFLAEALPEPREWSEEASRVLTLAHAKGLRSLLANWLKRYSSHASEKWPQFSDALEHLRIAGLTDAEIRSLARECNLWDARSKLATPAGILFLQGTDEEILEGLRGSYHSENQIPPVLANVQPDRLERFLSQGLVFKRAVSTYGSIALANPGRFAKSAFSIFKSLQTREERIGLILQLTEADPETYFEAACEEVRSFLRQERVSDDVIGRVCAQFLLKHRLPDALELIGSWMAGFWQANAWNAPHQRGMILDSVKQDHPEMVLPMAKACTRCVAPNVILLGLKWWRECGIDGSADEFHEAVRRLLTHADPSAVVSGIAEARDFGILRTEEDLWPLMQHKSRPVRGAAARALSGLGFGAVTLRASQLLGHKKAEVRQAAVMLLSHTGGNEALAVLKQHLDVEENDDVRDDILLALERAGDAAALSKEEQQARITKTIAKAKSLPAEWIKIDALTFKRRDGTALSANEVLYLLIRQSRCKEMRADLEAKPFYATLDRAACSDSALALLQSFLGSPQDASDRWVMVVAALAGDDRLVPLLRKAILDWADNCRGKLAEYAVQALALVGSDAALMVVDSLSVRFRSKNKNIGQAAADAFAAAAESRGVTVEELGDLVVPWLGFEPSKPRLVETPKGQVEARIDSELKLNFRDVKSGKSLSKLPAGASAEVQAEFKTLATTLKEAVKAQMLRIETLLVRQFRWPVSRWQELYLAHPLLRPFAQRLVWGWRDDAGELGQTFRALDDDTLSDVEDNAVSLPAHGSVSLVHPLDLSDEARAAWLKHLLDYDITPPIAQFDRPVIRVKTEETECKFGNQVAGTDVNAMTFRSRAEKLGWSRGSVCDAGSISGYRKIYTGAGVDAFLNLDGMSVGMGIDDTITLGTVFFVKSGSVQVGSYVYDEPTKEDDPRLIAFGNVPPVPYSETMGDLVRISGKNAESETSAE